MELALRCRKTLLCVNQGRPREMHSNPFCTASCHTSAVSCRAFALPTGLSLTPFENTPMRCYISVMCGRITQKSNPKVLGPKIATLVEPLFEAPPRYNGAPSQEHWVIRQHPETGDRTLDRLTWGLIPGWIKEASPKLKPINATAERVASAPMFRAAYAKRRCLLPIDSFFEWKPIKGVKMLWGGRRGPCIHRRLVETS